MRVRYVGLFVGLIAGFVWMALGFEKLIVVAVMGAIGYFVGAALAGDIDVGRYIDSFRGR